MPSADADVVEEDALSEVIRRMSPADPTGTAIQHWAALQTSSSEHSATVLSHARFGGIDGNVEIAEEIGTKSRDGVHDGLVGSMVVVRVARVLVLYAPGMGSTVLRCVLGGQEWSRLRKEPVQDVAARLVVRRERQLRQ